MTWPQPVEVDGVIVEPVHMEVLDFEARRLRVWVLWGDTLRSADVEIPEDQWESAWASHNAASSSDGEGTR